MVNVISIVVTTWFWFGLWIKFTTTIAMIISIVNFLSCPTFQMMKLRWTEKFLEKLMSCCRTSRILCNRSKWIFNKPITKFYITCWRILVFCANWKLLVKTPAIPRRGPWTTYSDKEKFALFRGPQFINSVLFIIAMH